MKTISFLLASGFVLDPFDLCDSEDIFIMGISTNPVVQLSLLSSSNIHGYFVHWIVYIIIPVYVTTSCVNQEIELFKYIIIPHFLSKYKQCESMFTCVDL
jgi:hypothetical protein